MTEDERARAYHSVTIGGKNTWKDYRLIPTSPPSVAAPEVKTNYVDVPGADGQLDFTEALDSAVHYGMREGSWEFLVNHEEIEHYSWAALWSRLLTEIHGKRLTVALMDETPESGGAQLFYVGRITLNEWRSDPAHSKVTMNYILDPYRYPSVEDAQNHTNGVF